MQGRSRAASVLAAAALWLGASPAAAQGEGYPVRIESDPPGATISLDEGEEIGETPFEGSLPAGVHTLLFEHPGYETGVEVMEVRKSGERQTLSIELVEERHGEVEVSSAQGTPPLGGAEVRVDGDPIGEAPARLSVSVGPHHLEIVKPGFEVYEAWIEVGEGETVEIEASLEEDPDAQVSSDPAETAAPAGAPFVIAGGGLSFGNRTFRYENPQTGNLRPYDARAVPLLSAAVELYPLVRTENEWLTGIALVGAAGWALPVDSSTEEGEVIPTSWREYDVAARALLPVASDVRAGLEAGHGRSRFAFGDSGALSDEVPDVDYRYARIGAAGSSRLGGYELRAKASYISPYEAGRTAERFAEAGVWGLSLEASVTSRLTRHFAARLGAHYTRYAYNLNAAADGDYQAEGGGDHYFGLGLGGHFRY